MRTMRWAKTETACASPPTSTSTPAGRISARSRPSTPFICGRKASLKKTKIELRDPAADSDWSHVSIAEKPFSAKHYNTNTTAWYEYITGNLPNYPLKVLAANNRLIDQQLARMRSGDGDPLTWDTVEQINGYPDSLSMQVDGYAIHAWQEFCPVYFESLVQLQWGAPMHISHGGFQHATFRYYNSATQRPGLPDSVAALVTRISASDADVQLANTGDERSPLLFKQVLSVSTSSREWVTMPRTRRRSRNPHRG